MPINVDWLGDGWVFYPDDERRAEELHKQKVAELAAAFRELAKDIEAFLESYRWN